MKIIQYVLADVANNYIYGVGQESNSCMEDVRTRMHDNDKYVYSVDIREAVENNALVLTKCDNALREYLEKNGIGKINGYTLKIKNSHCLTLSDTQR